MHTPFQCTSTDEKDHHHHNNNNNRPAKWVSLSFMIPFSEVEAAVALVVLLHTLLQAIGVGVEDEDEVVVL